ncbi:hypothetical protein FOZ61_001814 [Perkinsus olseni]|uniref:Hedgehog protein Hint domain-containing protein n=1 Tax=Perkinsus olseni TaxID=32597 RepID=A0A7J6LVB3_PEROL|nr:hypothetical protein FOZ61_001814 [Perkinsus olseni]
MDHGRRTSNLLGYLERIRDRARRDVTMGVTADALRANAEERRRRAARRRERKIIARAAKHSEPIEIENSPRRENAALPEDEGPPLPLVSSMLSAAELEDLLETRTERIQPVKTVRDAAIAPAVLVEWRATVKELLSLVKEAEGCDVPEEELGELRQMVSVDLEENFISPLVAGILGRLVDEEAARLHHKILLRSTAEAAAHNISDEDSIPYEKEAQVLNINGQTFTCNRGDMEGCIRECARQFPPADQHKCATAIEREMGTLPLCFPSTARVRVKAKGEISVAELKLGDLVLTGEANEVASFQRLVTWLHYSPEDVEHLTYDPEASDFVRADQARSVCLLNPLEGTCTGVSSIAKSSPVHCKGVYCPLTTSGTIIVDDVLCSCFASPECIPFTISHRAALIVTSPIRFSSVESTPAYTDIHPHCRWLMDATSAITTLRPWWQLPRWG